MFRVTRPAGPIEALGEVCFVTGKRISADPLVWRASPRNSLAARPLRVGGHRMLSVRKTALITGLKVGGLEVRKAELDFYILRYIMTSGVATVWTGECHLR